MVIEPSIPYSGIITSRILGVKGFILNDQQKQLLQLPATPADNEQGN